LQRALRVQAILYLGDDHIHRENVIGCGAIGSAYGANDLIVHST